MTFPIAIKGGPLSKTIIRERRGSDGVFHRFQCRCRPGADDGREQRTEPRLSRRDQPGPESGSGETTSSC